MSKRLGLIVRCDFGGGLDTCESSDVPVISIHAQALCSRGMRSRFTPSWLVPDALSSVALKWRPARCAMPRSHREARIGAVLGEPQARPGNGLLDVATQACINRLRPVQRQQSTPDYTASFRLRTACRVDPRGHGRGPSVPQRRPELCGRFDLPAPALLQPRASCSRDSRRECSERRRPVSRQRAQDALRPGSSVERREPHRVDERRSSSPFVPSMSSRVAPRLPQAAT